MTSDLVHWIALMDKKPYCAVMFQACTGSVLNNILRNKSQSRIKPRMEKKLALVQISRWILTMTQRNEVLLYWSDLNCIFDKVIVL